MKINKRGSSIVEAALVMPLIILVMITVVLIVMFFYSQMTEQSRMHMALRAKGVLDGEKMKVLHDASWDGDIYSRKGIGEIKLYGKKYIVMDHAGLLKRKGVFKVEAEHTFVKGSEYVRYCNLIKGKKDE